MPMATSPASPIPSTAHGATPTTHSTGRSRRPIITYPTNHQVRDAYDPRGQLSTLTDWLSGTTTYTYDSAGRMTGVALPNSVSTTLGYDITDRLTSITHAKGGTNLEAITYV